MKTRWAGVWRVVIAAGLLAAPRGASATPQTDDRVGVLVIAHGGSNQWNATIHKAVKQAKLSFSTEVALGMGMHGQEVRMLQQAVNRLERKGVNRIVIVPLFVSSHSEVFRQYEYLFGLRADAQWPEAGEPLDLEVPVVMGKALDDHPVISAILFKRAASMSRKPDEETVILVAHGPVNEADDQLWIERLQRVARYIKDQGKFRDVLSLTIRDDAPKAIKDRATQQLRAAVDVHSQHGRVLVVPVLMARGGIERKIPQLLSGLSYAYSGETLLPDPRISGWIAQEANDLATTAPSTSTNVEQDASGGSAAAAAVVE